MKKRFGKTDVIVLTVILAVLLVVGIFTYFSPKSEGAKVVISVDGELYREVSLKKDQVVEIEKNGITSNVLEIRDGKADMTSADCPDKLCVHQRAISKNGETIVCLPNRVVVEVTGALDGDLDSMAQ